MAPCRKALTQRVAWRLALALIIAAGADTANADSLTQKDVQIMAKAIGFLEPPPSGTAVVAIAYDRSDPASRQDAEAIASHFGDGLKAGGAVVMPKLMEVGALPAGGFLAVIAASGVKIDQVAGVARTLHVLCITADVTAIQSGQCVMSVKSNPKVEILISRSAAADSGINFGSAFLLMAHEI